MTDPPLFPVADTAGDGTSDEPLGSLTVEDGLEPDAADPARAHEQQAHEQQAHEQQVADYQADEAHDWTGGSTP